MENHILDPSLLSADFSNLGKAIEMIENGKAGAVHIDVMDGNFVPEITYGEPVIRSIRPLTKLPFDVHLMVVEPEKHIESFAKAGADWITFHLEAVENEDEAIKLLEEIHKLGKKAGISIKPDTPISALSKIMNFADIILVMTVNPGFGAQAIIPSCVDKVKELFEIKQERKLNFLISVDGGINEKTLNSVLDAGTNLVVSGSAFFKGTLGWKE